MKGGFFLLVKKIAGVLLALLAACALTACSCNGGVAQIAKPGMSEGAEAFEVKGSCGAELVDGGQALQVNGTCNLMNGTNGVVSILGADGVTLERKKFTKESDDLAFEFEVQSDWPEIVYGFISFDTQQSDSQPREVTDVYGNRFQNLEGDDVIWDLKGVIAVFQSEPVEIKAAS